MTQSGGMATKIGLLLALCSASLLMAQTPADDDPIVVSTEHPRLLLRPARLRLLRRERDRTSARWQQFQLFLAATRPCRRPASPKRSTTRWPAMPRRDAK